MSSEFSTQITPRPSIPGSGPGPGSTPRAASPAIDDWGRLERFLVLGCEAGTLHVGDRELGVASARAVARCIAADGLRTIDRIVAVCESGRAPKNDPAILSLAIAAKLGDDATRRAAYAALPRVCRIATQLMQFAAYAQGLGGWGRGMRKAVGAWFNGRPAAELALQLARYPSRDGWSNRDLLRLAHPRAASPSHDHLFAWAVTGELPAGAASDPALALIAAIDELEATDDASLAARLVRDHRIPRECVPSRWLGSAEMWDAMLAAMPVAVALRNLATMTRVGLLTAESAATRQVSALLRDPQRLARARVHPIALLAALATYRSGRGVRGSAPWQPVTSLVDALDAAFHAGAAAVAASGKRTLIALDVSSSMSRGAVTGLPSLSPRTASAAMALVTAASERDSRIAAFGAHGIATLAISPRDRLDEVIAAGSALPIGGVDCALPMIWAREHRIDVDVFCIYTDNDPGACAPAVQALRVYRDARGIAAKLVVIGMTSTGFTIADPDDAGMIDVIGFDASTPISVANFARGVYQ